MSAASSHNTAIGAIGAVLGYIGAGAASPAMFERLLWPQRAYSGLDCGGVIKLAFLGAGCGPIYKATVQVLDNACAFGLLRGKGLGRMLGTEFFPHCNGTYTLHGNDSSHESHTEPARNCIWARVVALMPNLGTTKQVQDEEAADGAPRVIRANVAVHHLTLSLAKVSSNQYSALDICTDSRRHSLGILVGICASETTSVLLAVSIVAVWQSWLAILWLYPLAIKLLSAVTALDREPLILEPSESQEDKSEKPCDFEVQLPEENGTFLLITGPPSLVLQYFRHFGHPKRHRIREVLQLALVVASAGNYPLGLLCLVTAMPVAIQYTWLSYQLYVVLTMYIARYLCINLWSSTEHLIARALSKNPDGVCLWQDVKRGLAVKAEVKSTFHGRYKDGRDHLMKLLNRPVSEVHEDN